MKPLLSIVCAFLLLGCNNDETTTQTPPNLVAVEVNVTADATKPLTTPEAVPVETTTEEPILPAAKSTPPASTPPQAKQISAPQPKPAALESASVDGATVYGQKCASCHGTKGEKPALGKSQVIAGWSETQTKEALKGYQAGTYGKEMKALMQGQAKGLSDEQIVALAKHISTL